MKRTASLIAPALLLLASACEDTEPAIETGEQGGEASGDVLGGTISDDMLPLEELQSTSPPANESEDADDADG